MVSQTYTVFGFNNSFHISMNRRRFLIILGAAAAGAACTRFWPEGGLWNPCLGPAPPSTLLQHPLVQSAWAGVDPTACWDTHVHLLGIGDSGNGIWVNPAMQRWLRHPARYTQYRFYLNAACVEHQDRVDAAYVERLQGLAGTLPVGSKVMLLAFDHYHDTRGRRVEQRSPFFVSNAYAAATAAALPERFEWIASIHPYREDSVEALADAAAKGARGVKWLPSLMGIDPASPSCDRFYEALASFDLPLLSHGGAELAVLGGVNELNNPLRLRRALDHGVRVIVAHAASMGEAADLDRGAQGRKRENFALFARMMDEPRYEGRLFGDLSAIAQINRSGAYLRTLLEREEWHGRLLNGSDYPLPAILPLFALHSLAREFITEDDAAVLSEIRRYNALLFDWVLKRRLAAGGRRFPPAVFETRRVFDKTFARAGA